LRIKADVAMKRRNTRHQPFDHRLAETLITMVMPSIITKKPQAAEARATDAKGEQAASNPTERVPATNELMADIPGPAPPGFAGIW